MNFTFYTEKTLAQSTSALMERLNQKGAKLDGWVQKDGRFSLAVSCTVMRLFPRSTRLNARIERENGMTVIRGYVSDGADQRNRIIIYGILILAGVVIALSSGNILIGSLAILAPIFLNIPLEGDNTNSQTLIHELQRVLKAKSTPPAATKKPTATKPLTTSSARSSTPTKKPVAKSPAPRAATTRTPRSPG